MSSSQNANTTFTFVDAFKLAAANLISNLPSDLSDDAAEDISRELSSEINTSAAKLQLLSNIIYTKASADQTWASTAVKLFSHLAYSLTNKMHDPDLSPGKTNVPLSGTLLLRRYIHTTLQDDFQEDMATPSWSVPRL
jgi:hypothetical protein